MSCDGAFYVIQLAPDVAPGRVKLGWASNARKRLADHRCAAPTAQLVQSWPCHRGWEQEAIYALTTHGCRPLSKEAFDVDTVATLIDRAEEFFRTHTATLPRSRSLARPMAEPELLTVDEVAARLRLSRETVRRWLRVGRIQGVRLATERAGWRIPASEVDEMLSEGRQIPLPESADQKKAAA